MEPGNPERTTGCAQSDGKFANLREPPLLFIVHICGPVSIDIRSAQLLNRPCYSVTAKIISLTANSKMGRTIKLRVLSAKGKLSIFIFNIVGLPANEKEIRLKVFTPKDSVKTKYHKSNDIGSVDFQGEILEVALSKDKQEMRIELYIKKKSIAAVLLTSKYHS